MYISRQYLDRLQRRLSSRDKNEKSEAVLEAAMVLEIAELDQEGRVQNRASYEAVGFGELLEHEISKMEQQALISALRRQYEAQPSPDLLWAMGKGAELALPYLLECLEGSPLRSEQMAWQAAVAVEGCLESISAPGRWTEPLQSLLNELSKYDSPRISEIRRRLASELGINEH